MKKLGPIRAPGWMSIPVVARARSATMRDERHREDEELVREAVLGNRRHAGVAEQRLVEELRGGIAVEGRPNVRDQGVPDRRQAGHEGVAHLPGPPIAAPAERSFALVIARAGEREGAAYLRGQDRAGSVEPLAEVGAQGAAREVRRAEVRGEKQGAQIVDHSGDGLARWELASAGARRQGPARRAQGVEHRLLGAVPFGDVAFERRRLGRAGDRSHFGGPHAHPTSSA